MILVDSSVWVDYLRNAPTWQADVLDRALDSQKVLMGDLMLTEVLQGIDSGREFRQAQKLLGALPIITIVDTEVAVQAAEHYRWLRTRGITVRSTIDTLIATRCINEGIALLHSDRDFLPFERELGLRVVVQATH